ncbi:DUF1376 domain-containing protein [Herbaspirillum sp. RV1423]|uniref:DUF1376 domain-containing protein n=1 Tax=Herbaspirillum sp. RV1423 TaxID=1443993 RepID=UPI0004B3C3FC|nr:DUF1376 domain-containing protein [Herbaspirillum sp. RV1423]
MTELPTPLTPADCDLRDFMFMPLDVLRLRDSDIAVISSGDEFRCAVLLWCASWHQVPAASLPDDDVILSGLSGFGRVIKEWKKVREGALRGWIKCGDGRLYHPVVAEKANEAWRGRIDYREKKEAERLRKAALRAAQKAAEEAEEAARRLANCPADELDLSGGQNSSVQRTDTGSPAENALRGTVDSGQWTVDSGEGQLTSTPPSSSHTSNSVAPAQDGERDDSVLPNNAEKPKRNVEIAVLLRAKGIKPFTFAHPLAVEWADNPKITDDILIAAVEQARQYKGDADISPNYLKPIIADLLNPPAQREDNAWKRTDAGIDAKGREMGMFAKPTESYADYRTRIENEIRKRKQQKPDEGEAA